VNPAKSQIQFLELNSIPTSKRKGEERREQEEERKMDWDALEEKVTLDRRTSPQFG